MIYRFIEDHRSEYCVRRMCRVLEVSTSAFYDWGHRKPSQGEQENVQLLWEIRKIHSDSKTEDYGSPRMTPELHSRGYSCSEGRVARLMKINGIQAKRQLKYKITTNSKHKEAMSPN